MKYNIAALALVLSSQSGCFVAIDAGASVPSSGPIDSSPTTTLGFSIGFAADFGAGLVALGTGLVTHQVTRDSGEVDDIANFGPTFRADATLWHDPSPLIKGGNFGSIIRATSTVILGSCRKLDVDNAMRSGEEKCKTPSDSKIGDGLFVSMGALAGIRTDSGNTLSVSLSPYYASSKHDTAGDISFVGARARISLSGVPEIFSGIATLFSGYDYSENRRRMKEAGERNERSIEIGHCKGKLGTDSKGKTVCLPK
ncbi:MAG: hypothetical protein JKY56_20180 [Kofleriaceae bacterium]|nr:hypothetical protein [Kofleriaceae bacterium]